MFEILLGNPIPPTLPDPVEPGWVILSPGPQSGEYISLVHLNGYLHAFGGQGGTLGSSKIAAHHKYHIATDSWSQCANLPMALDSVGAIAYEGKIYAFGGRDYTQNGVPYCYQYDPVLDRWVILKSLPAATHGVGLAVKKQNIHIVGGATTGTTSVANNYQYSPLLNTYSTKTQFPAQTNRRGVYQPLLLDLDPTDNFLYCFGGAESLTTGGSSQWTTRTMQFGTTTNRWTELVDTPMPKARVGGSGGGVHNGKAYLWGSYVSPNNQIDVFDGTSWSIISPLLGEPQLPRQGAGTVVVDGALYVYGGTPFPGGVTGNTLLRYGLP